MAKIHGGQPGFSFVLNSVSLCGDKAGIEVSRDIQDGRTNCGNEKDIGFTDTKYNISGPLDFGSGLTEPTLWTHMTATAGQSLVVKASTASTGTGNPTYTGTAIGTSYKISLAANAVTTYDFSAVESGSAGIPTRATS